MKKVISLLLIIILSVIALGGCNSNQIKSTPFEEPTKQITKEKIDINIAALKGPTAMGMVKLMEDAENNTASNNYNFTISSTADEIVAKIAKSELDIAAVPANLSSVLYNNTKGKISVAGINTLGVLYVVQTIITPEIQQIKTVEDLRGMTILSTGKGTTPEFALNYILSSNGIDPQKDVTVEYKSEATEIIATMQSSSATSVIAVLPQPYLTTAQSKNENLHIVLDLSKEWDNIPSENKSSMITGVIIARNEFIENNKEAFDKFLDEYKTSTHYVNSNINQASTLIEKYNIIPATVAEKAIPECNIIFIEGDDMKQKVNGYLEVLFKQNPNSIGGNLPDEAFYYKR